MNMEPNHNFILQENIRKVFFLYKEIRLRETFYLQTTLFFKALKIRIKKF